MTAIALQGQEDGKLPRWINLRQLGREFDMTGPAIGKHLDGLGLRDGKRPTAKATRMGVGRLLPASAHLETPVVQWQASKAIRALRDSGLTPVDAFTVFCRAAVDKTHTHLLAITREPDLSPPEQWWLVGELREHLAKVPDNRREEFVDGLVDGVEARKRRVRPGLVHSLLGALGELDQHLARMTARKLGRATADAGVVRSSLRRL